MKTTLPFYHKLTNVKSSCGDPLDISLSSKDLNFLNNYSIQDKTLENLMQLLYLELQNNGKNKQWFIDPIMNLFSGYFIRHYSNYEDLKQHHPSTSIIGPEELNLINQYIDENISFRLTIEDLANELAISKFHFLNEFKKYAGITPYQHILNKRIEKAKLLLSDQNKKITTIAIDLGFSDSSHFSRTFKKVTGESPKAFRAAL